MLPGRSSICMGSCFVLAWFLSPSVGKIIIAFGVKINIKHEEFQIGLSGLVIMLKASNYAYIKLKFCFWNFSLWAFMFPGSNFLYQDVSYCLM